MPTYQAGIPIRQGVSPIHVWSSVRRSGYSVLQLRMSTATGHIVAGQHSIDAAQGRVQRELADRDAHAANALVTQDQNPLPVGHDNDVDLGPGPVAQDLADAVAVGVGNEKAARTTVDLAEDPRPSPATGAASSCRPPDHRASWPGVRSVPGDVTGARSRVPRRDQDTV
jgi:hypothetical protein